MIEHACTYCGMIADSVDHVPPTTVRPTLIELKLVRQYPFTEVQACRECNVLLGRLALWTVASRRAYIKERLARRYRKYLSIPEWTDAELFALTDSMRESVEHGIAVKKVTLNRIAYQPISFRERE